MSLAEEGIKDDAIEQNPLEIIEMAQHVERLRTQLDQQWQVLLEAITKKKGLNRHQEGESRY